MYKRRTPYGSTLIHSVAISVCLVAVPFLTAHAQPSLPDSEALITQRDFDIPAQDMATALAAFARQSGKELLYTPEMAQGRTAPTVIGRMSSADAMAALLAGSNLDFVETASGGFMVGDQATITAYRQRMANEGVGLSGTAAPDSVAMTRYTGIEEVIVTGQKREERMQDVPIAISAFSMDALDAQKIEGGFDLLKSVPNVTFSKTNFTGYNFQIRGIGTQAISATTDPGVAVSFNNTTLIVNRLFEQEYLDVERVEVLRGPQGTLYGRNATAGVINVISAKPQMGVYGGEFKVEAGNHNAQRFRGHINVPLGDSDTLAARLAFAATRRDGYGTNLAAYDSDIQRFIEDNDRNPISADIDNRDLWTARFSLGWEPTDRFRANLIYERFEEDDKRMRSTKQLCHHHDGRVTLYDENNDPVAYDDAISHLSTAGRRAALGQTSQGCLPGSLFAKGDPTSADPTSHGAYGTPNANSSPFVRAGRTGTFNVNGGGLSVPSFPDCTAHGIFLISNCAFDPMATVNGQSRDMRDIFSLIDPRYEALAELLELSFDFEVSDGLTLSSQTVYMENELFSTQDFLRFKTTPMFSPTRSANNAWRRGVAPNGVFCDPQLGCSDRLLMQDVSQLETRQLSQEIRLVSNFDGPINYSVGANYTRFENTADYFVFINALPALSLAGAVYTAPLTSVPGPPSANRTGLWSGGGLSIGCGTFYAYEYIDPYSGIQAANCIYVQEGSIDEVRANPEGHHFFLSRNPFLLNSAGLFGELYVDLTPGLKLTAGLRMNWDRKTFTPTPSQTLLADWRGRLQGGSFGNNADLWTNQNRDMVGACHPRSPDNIRFENIFLWQPICALGGMAENGRGYPTLPDIVQEWRVPTGRIGLDWKPDLNVSWIDETLLYAFYTRGYKAGGANPPTQSAPSGLLLEASQGAAFPRVFEAEYVNAFEIGSKNTLFGGAMTLNLSGFYYDYKDYQVSKIVDRTAVNENFDATIWGLELEALFAPTQNTLLNAAIGYLRTRIGDGTESLDLMDRTQGGNNVYVDPGWASIDCSPGSGNENSDACVYPNGFDQWVVVRPTLTQASSCVAPAVLVRDLLLNPPGATLAADDLAIFCPGGTLFGSFQGGPEDYSPFTGSPNGGAGFLADISGNELPNAPRFTLSLGAQHTYWLTQDWSATGRVDWYWQDKSFHRVYNTEYDRLKDWTNTNLSLWVDNERWRLTIELYVKNVFDETPITGAFLNSDDTGLSTNVFTLDPRLVGLSVRKRF